MELCGLNSSSRFCTTHHRFSPVSPPKNSSVCLAQWPKLEKRRENLALVFVSAASALSPSGTSTRPRRPPVGDTPPPASLGSSSLPLLRAPQPPLSYTRPAPQLSCGHTSPRERRAFRRRPSRGGRRRARAPRRIPSFNSTAEPTNRLLGPRLPRAPTFAAAPSLPCSFSSSRTP